MECKLYSPGEWTAYYEKIESMLRAGDKEFVPSLSARASTLDADLGPKEKKTDSIERYFDGLKKQSLLAAVEAEKLLGFVSFKEDYELSFTEMSFLPNIYISTVLVSPEARGRHLTQAMYTSLFTAFAHKHVMTRTWTTNVAHIKILSRFGFERFHEIPNDRGDGIDTVYFIKKIKTEG